MMARFGPHTGTVAMPCVQSTPSRARRSRWGVIMSELPAQRMSMPRIWSANTKSRLGRLGCNPGVVLVLSITEVAPDQEYLPGWLPYGGCLTAVTNRRSKEGRFATAHEGYKTLK